MSNNDERQERIAQIRARVEAATPGPWVTWPDGTEESVEAVAVGRFVCHLNSNMRQFREDAALIANAPADLAYLLSELAAAQAREQALTRAVEKAADWHSLSAHEFEGKWGNGWQDTPDPDGLIALDLRAALAAAGGEGQG